MPFKVLWSFGLISESHKVTKFWIKHKWRHTLKYTKHLIPGCLFIFFQSYVEKSSYKVLLCIWQFFKKSYGVANVWIIKLYLDVSEAIHANEYSKHLFHNKKDHVKQKLLLWHQVSFNNVSSSKVIIIKGSICVNIIEVYINKASNTIRECKVFGLSLKNVKLSYHRYQVLYYHSRIQHYHNPQAF